MKLFYYKVYGVVLNDVEHRGLQSADFVFRLNKHWQQYKKDIIRHLERGNIYRILDKEKASRVNEMLFKFILCNDEAN